MRLKGQTSRRSESVSGKKALRKSVELGTVAEHRLNSDDLANLKGGNALNVSNVSDIFTRFVPVPRQRK